MRKLFWLILIALWAVPAASETAWETSWDSALARAGREGKPILLLELFGRLDEALC